MPDSERMNDAVSLYLSRDKPLTRAYIEGKIAGKRVA